MEENRPYFMPYQDAWIDDDSPLKIAEKSRRVGFTYASSYRMYQKCMTRRNFTQWVSSRDQLTAQELIRDYIAKWAEMGNLVTRGLYGEGVEVIDREKNITAFVANFPSTQSRIVSLSSTPEAFAGKGGDVFLDEADLHKDSGRLIDMAYPCIMWGGQLEIVSAYRVDGSKNTPFARMVAEAKGENPQRAKLHRVTIHDAIAQGLVEKINEQTGRNLTREEFLRQTRAGARTQAAWESQFECRVQDGSGKVLPTALVAPCEFRPEEIKAICDRFPNAPRFAGFDIARKVHGSAWHSYALIGTTLFLEEREVFHDRDFSEQRKFLDQKMTRREKRIARLAMDATGLGMQMAEEMGKAYPGRVDAVNLESGRRHEIIILTRDKYQNRRIGIPEDPHLREDLGGPYFKNTTNGNLRVVVPQFDGADGEVTHCDEFMAQALGVSASEGYAAGACQPPDDPVPPGYRYTRGIA